MFKFIHAADIHLDSPLLNLDQYEGAPVDALRVATREAFDNLVQLAIDEQVRFVLIAGDLYDKDTPNFNTPIHVRNRMRELLEHNIEVHIIQGNHDATADAKRAFALTMPENVHVYSTKQPETKTIEDVQVAIHGQGFAQRAIVEDLSIAYPPSVSGYYNIGLLHTNLGGRATHDNYAPSTYEGLAVKEYQYWALGHIHKLDKSLGPNPHVIYPGNTQGRHIRETGPKGCVLVTVNDNRDSSLVFRTTDVWRWQQCDVSATSCETAEDVKEITLTEIARALQKAEERSLAVRVRVTGATLAHRSLLNRQADWREQLRVAVLDQFDDRVWLEKILLQTKQPATSETRHADAAWGDLIAAILDVDPSRELLADVHEDLRKMLRTLPDDARISTELADLDDEASITTLVNDAKELLVAKLLDTGDSA